LGELYFTRDKLKNPKEFWEKLKIKSTFKPSKINLKIPKMHRKICAESKNLKI
jgi:hypothetical protein